MHKQVSGWTVNFGPNFLESRFLELKTRKPPPPISANFRFGMTKVYSGIPSPISENFRFGMTKVYSGIPPLCENCQRVQVQEFQNTESYYMWRLYPTRITTSSGSVTQWLSVGLTFCRFFEDESFSLNYIPVVFRPHERRKFKCLIFFTKLTLFPTSVRHINLIK